MPLLARDPREQRDDLLRAAQVEVRERLVEQQQLRRADQRVGDQDPLLLAAREPADARVGEAARADRVEHLVDARARARATAAAIPRRWPSSPRRDEVAGAQRHVGVEQELLRDVADQLIAPRAPRARRPAPCRRSPPAGRG